MGGRAQVKIIGNPDLADLAVQRVEHLEALWSRFRPDSEVSTANQDAGHPVAVSGETILLASLATRGQVLTSGRFDPLLGLSLAQLGYDRTFCEIGTSTPRSPVDLPAATVAALCIDAEAGTITVPSGHAFDPGGIGKGLAGDLVVANLLEAGADGVLVDLGGDVRVAGAGPTDAGWLIAVEDPLTEGAELLRLHLTDGAVASSSRLRRRWQQGAEERHHLLDPDTGRPSDNSVVGVSVVAANGWQAEVFAKDALLAGPRGAIAALEAQDVEGVVVLDDGRHLRTAGLSVLT